ncbi:hypothetical protein GH714_012072 [Hevea brasiliensis]|uniref:Nodulin-like domain-containing protein n=1 Tax=Hevea brasiliensis TaxID=3981 RepID=A0A6A6MXN5_HEVBR|nr:hypothetical protein GH714_012072 [Hevea brasiliensis]
MGGLGAAVWLQIASGNSYNFALYSHSLKSVLGFNQQQLTMLGVANDIGGMLDSSLLWLALCVATNSSPWLGTAVLVTNMRNFPRSRGTVAGILKGYVGISAAVFSAIYSMLLHSSSSKLLMFLALGIPVLCFLMMYFVRACTPASGEDSSEHAHFLFTQAALIILGFCILITMILDHMLHLSPPICYTFLIIMFVLLMAPLAIPIKMTLYRTRTSKLGMLETSVGSSDNLIQGEANADKTEPLLKSSSSAHILGSFHESDETSEIGIAQGVNDTTTLLSLFSFFNFVGRLGGGTVSEHFVRSKTIPRTIWLTCTQVIMIITCLLFASAIDGTLYAATASLGICFGVQFSIMIPTVSELFGLKHFSIFYNFMSLGNPIGAFLFSYLLAGYVYDNEAAKQHD